MPPKDLYADLDETTLRQLLLDAMKDLKSMSGTEATAKEEEIEKIKNWLKEACGERIRKAVGLTETLTVNGSNSERNQRMRDLKIAVDSIPRFAPGMNINVFINSTGSATKKPLPGRQHPIGCYAYFCVFMF